MSGRTTYIPPVAPSRRLYGYESELSTLVDALSGQRHLGALIIGAAGVGKTALVNTALSRLDPDLSVTRLRGSENARARNLGIFEILLSREGIDTDLPPGRALSVIGDLFERRAAGGRCLVVVDNADLVDDHSLAVLAQLTDARRITLVIAAESARPPVDLIAGVAQCIEQENYPQAAELYTMAMTYGFYDTLRVSDQTAHQALMVVRMNAFTKAQQSELVELQDAIAARLEAPELCEQLQAIGKPQYHPDYMIEHGMEAFSAMPEEKGGLVADFDAQAAWQHALQTVPKCVAETAAG